VRPARAARARSAPARRAPPRAPGGTSQPCQLLQQIHPLSPSPLGGEGSRNRLSLCLGGLLPFAHEPFFLALEFVELGVHLLALVELVARFAEQPEGYGYAHGLDLLRLPWRGRKKGPPGRQRSW